MAAARKKSVILKILASLDVVGKYIFFIYLYIIRELEIKLIGVFRRLTNFQLKRTLY